MAQIIPLDVDSRTSTLLRRMFEDHQEGLIRYLHLRLRDRAEAEDLAQLAFLKLWERQATLNDENLVSLLFVTGRNLATDVLRSRRAGRLAMFEAKPGLERQDDAPSAERALITRSELATVRKILTELPPKCQQAFTAYAFEDSSYHEIASAMNLTESMVRKYVRRAMVYCAARYAMLDGWE